LVVALTILALVLRLAFVMAVQRKSFGYNDAVFYQLSAESIAKHGSYTAYLGIPTVQWPPGYPFLLSLVYRFTDSDPFSGEVLNAVLGALTVPLLYFVAKRLFGRTEAIIAGAALALFPGQILWTDVLLTETFYTLIVIGYVALLLLSDESWYWLLIMGVVTAAAALTRGEGLFLLLIALSVWSARYGWRKAVGGVAITGLVVVLCVAPWTLRNYRTADTFVPISANVGATLYAGHNRRAAGYSSFPRPAVTANIHASAGAKQQVAVSNRLQKRATDYLLRHPLRELQLIPLKLINLNSGDAAAVEWINEVQKGRPPVTKKFAVPLRIIADFAYFALLATTLMSIVLGRRAFWRDPVLRGVLVWFLVTAFLYGFVFYGDARYHAALEPLMILVSAPLIAQVWRRPELLRPSGVVRDPAR
jgi:4-amino-4-deoxy-L-arabinose transferase-like glycosyltransferase